MDAFATVIIMFIIEHVFTTGLVAFYIWDRRVTRIHIAKLQSEIFEKWRQERQKSEAAR